MNFVIVCLALFLPVLGSLKADVVNYQGRVRVSGQPFNGIGRFRFELINDQGATAWSSEAISLNVSNGVYAVRLGDSAQAPTIGDSILRQADPVKLRIWFEQKDKGWAKLGEDVLVTNDRAQAATGVDGAAILAELRAIHALLAGQHGGPHQPEAPQIVTVPIAGAPSLGMNSAPLVLVEFTDYQCTFCIRHQNETFAQLKADYVDTGKLRIISRNLPLPFHPFAEPAARAAVCAQAQGKFWPMHDKLFAAGDSLSTEAIGKAAAEVGLDTAALAACSENKQTSDVIVKDGQDAKALGIDGTPSFVLGKLSGDMVTGVRIVGAQPFANFEAEIKKQLAEGGAK